MKRILSIALLFLSMMGFSQELNCEVNIQANPSLDITTTEKEILSELQQAITDLMNNTVWTKDRFEVEERINCVFQLSITEVGGGGNYKANLQVQATRPVFNSTYNTTLINFLDEDVSFNYRRGTKVLFSENQFTDNLTSILGFYAFYILGIDGDSFAQNGGDPYFTKAQNIVQLAQSTMGSGWKANSRGQRNRYWLIENRLQELFSPLRACTYEYHRLGLDQMYDNPVKAREAIYAALQKLNEVNRARPGSVNVTNFLYAKRTEIGNVFADAETQQKTNLLNLLRRLDPSNASKYQEILQ